MWEDKRLREVGNRGLSPYLSPYFITRRSRTTRRQQSGLSAYTSIGDFQLQELRSKATGRSVRLSHAGLALGLNPRLIVEA